MQVADINQQIISLKYENKLLRVELGALKSDLEIFLAEYLDLVGDLSAELAVLEDKINGCNNKAGAAPIIATKAKMTRTDFFEQEVKSIYRKLVKQVHPDVCKNMGAEQYVQKLSEAYNNTDLLGLLKLEQEICKQSEPLLMQRKTYNALVDANYELKLEIEELKNDPAYLLKCKFEHLGQLRQMAIAEVRASLRRKISDARQTLIAKKLDYLESVQAKIVA